MASWMTSLAPTSTPRVGSSRMQTSGGGEPLGQQDLLLVAAGELRPPAAGARAGQLQLAGEVPRMWPGRWFAAAAGGGRVDGGEGVLPGAVEQRESLELAVLGQVGEAAADRVAEVGGRQSRCRRVRSRPRRAGRFRTASGPSRCDRRRPVRRCRGSRPRAPRSRAGGRSRSGSGRAPGGGPRPGRAAAGPPTRRRRPTIISTSCARREVRRSGASRSDGRRAGP